MSLIDSFALRRSFANTPTTAISQSYNPHDKMYRGGVGNNPATQLPSLQSLSSPTSIVLQLLSEVLRSGGALNQPPQLLSSQSKNSYILQAVPTDQVASQLHQAGLANTFNENWQALVAEAAHKNGGFGNPQEGYLAFTEIGFARFANQNLSAEQNKRLAEISLDTGFQIEKMPSRAESTGEKISQWVDKFIKDYDIQMAKFVEDPAAGIAIKDGRKRFEMKVDPASGQVISLNYKESRGLKGLVEKAYKYLSPVADGTSLIGSFFPGAGTVVAAAAQGVKGLAGAVVSGGSIAKQLLGSLVSAGASLIPGGSTLGSIAQSALTTAGNYLSTGKLKVQDLIFTTLTGIQNKVPQTGFEFLDNLISKGIDYGIAATDPNSTEKPSFGDFLRSIFNKGQEEKVIQEVQQKPADPISNGLNADDPLLEGFTQPIEGATILT